MREKCGKRQFLLQYQKRYVDLRISNNSSNNFLSAVVLQVFTENTALKKLLTFLMTSRRQKQVRKIKTADTLLRRR
jgi:hypothetical protein